jgi:hypothetical protein
MRNKSAERRLVVTNSLLLDHRASSDLASSASSGNDRRCILIPVHAEGYAESDTDAAAGGLAGPEA